MAKIEMSDKLINNALVFLQRVNLKGSEAEALLEIVYALKNPIRDEVEPSA